MDLFFSPELLRARAQSGMPAAPRVTPDENTEKIQKAGRDFEAVLLNQLLDKLESTFATVPGREDTDSTAEQFKGLGVQALSGMLAAHDVLGTSKLISGALSHASGEEGGTQAAQSKKVK
jgi:hypothetical protein